MSHELHTLKAPPLGALIADEYRLVRFLGAGGVGAVYEAATPDGSHVALKIMLGDAIDRELVERFRREARFTSTLDSPHIVKTLQAGVDETLRAPFLIMPLMVGFDLGRLLDRIGPIHPTVAVRVVRQVCAALSVAHAQGIVHRDVKPANIFLDHDSDGKVTVRVLDFGVAKWRSTDGAQLTRTNSLLGTPLYMAPEQFEDGKDVDARCDLWAVGATLYETLSGTVPFGASAQNIAELVLALATTDPPPLQELAPWVDPALACLAHGALIRNRDARCPSSDDLSRALLPFAAGSDELVSTMFEPLPDEARCYQAPLLSRVPTSWQVEPPSVVAPTMAIADADPLLGKVLAGRYTLLQCLGRGGMGAVYEARTLTGSRIAVKVIRPEIAGSSESARRRFVREAKVVQSLDNPYVVRLLDVDTDPEQELPFLAMELLHGHDLAMLIHQRGALSPATVARLFVHACRGLQAVHELGFVHRDIKPANLFLSRTPSAEVEIKICDFGVVKPIDRGAESSAALTHTGGVLGSPMYMSPEQATNSDTLDARSDIWSLGAAMYEALSGTPPWKGRGTMGELIVAVCTQPLDHLQDRAPWVSGELADIVHRAMRKLPADRFQSMEELARALEPLTKGRIAVRHGDLRGVSDRERARVGPRAIVKSGEESAGSALEETVAQPGKKRRSGPMAAVLALGALVAVGAGAAALSQNGETRAPPVAEPPPPAETVTPSAVPAASKLHRVRILVEPADATVTVNGKEHTLDDGALVLEGAAGSRFNVMVQHAKRRLEREVFIDVEGQPSLERLALPPAPSAKAPQPEVKTAPPPPLAPSFVNSWGAPK